MNQIRCLVMLVALIVISSHPVHADPASKSKETKTELQFLDPLPKRSIDLATLKKRIDELDGGMYTSSLFTSFSRFFDAISKYETPSRTTREHAKSTLDFCGISRDAERVYSNYRLALILGARDPSEGKDVESISVELHFLASQKVDWIRSSYSVIGDELFKLSYKSIRERFEEISRGKVLADGWQSVEVLASR